jgi:hypothetical protein
MVYILLRAYLLRNLDFRPESNSSLEMLANRLTPRGYYMK